MGREEGSVPPRLSLVLELSEEELDALVEEATVDAYNNEEQLGGFAVMIEDNLEMPFETTVLGVMVTVKGVTQTESGSSRAASATDSTRRSLSLTCRCPSRRRRVPSGSPPTSTGPGTRERVSVLRVPRARQAAHRQAVR
jgi:hypothetical protein